MLMKLKFYSITPTLNGLSRFKRHLASGRWDWSFQISRSLCRL